MRFARPRHRRRGQAPTVSATPPNRRSAPPPIQGPRETDRRTAEPTQGRVISVLGPPCAGVSTMLRLLAEVSSARVAIVRPDFEDLAQQVREAHTADVIFIDSYPRMGFDDQTREPVSPRGVQYLYDNRLVYPGSGALVRVSVEPDLCFRRGASTEALDAWFQNLGPLEERVRLLDLPYFTVHNEAGRDGLMQGIGDLARRASLKD